MSKLVEELEQIKTLILSTRISDRLFAYSTLLHLQEQSSSDDYSIRLLAECTRVLLSPVIADIQEEDEETAAQALKCLGFMIYHPSLVAEIPMDTAGIVVESLARLITTTKIKSVCNLGVWCLSIQQLDSSFLATHFDSLLRAIVHSLDNPMGSLSTTFEAIQAVMKFVTELSEKMRETSSIWAPPIYRRLLSLDKRERDMCHRCLLKIKSMIFPPPLTLSKAVVRDMKSKLLPDMKELVKNGKKVQALQAWGWFVRLLGSHVLKSKHLVNEMLKVPEQTFSDQDPQVQIASQVAWEGLIDSLIHVSVNVSDTITMGKSKIQQDGAVFVDISKVEGSKLQMNDKCIKLIMTPLIGILSSKCDVAVRSSCLNTWCYLLHKMDASVNDPHVLRTVLEPIFKAVYQNGPDNKNIWLWNFCINLLDEFVQAKTKNINYESIDQVNLSARITNCESPISGECLWKHYSVKWLPWNCSQLDFLLTMICVIVSGGMVVSVSAENRNLACDGALRIFHSILKGVLIDFKTSSASYNVIMQSLNTILMFVKKICEDVLLEDDSSASILVNCLHFVEAVVEDLEPSILGSPLYRVALEVKYIGSLQSAGECRLKRVFDISSIGFMDMVSPMVYLTILYISVLVQSMHKTASIEFILQGLCRYLSILFSSYDPLEVMHVIVGLLYDHGDGSGLRVWITIAHALLAYLDNSEDLLLQKKASKSDNLAVCQLLLFPLCICYTEKSLITSKACKLLESSSVFSLKLTFEQVTEVWKSLYCHINSAHRKVPFAMNRFAEDLCVLLNAFLDQCAGMNGYSTEFNSIHENQELELLLCGEVAICILENLQIGKVAPKGSVYGCRKSSGINNCLESVGRILKLQLTKREGERLTTMAVISRLLPSLASFVSRLQLKEDILPFFKATCDPLLQLLSDVESVNCHLQFLWSETLKCLQRSSPPIIFDSTFLKLQAPVLEVTLDHPKPSISEPTISFWNSTYGRQTKLDFPPCLLLALDKLYREGEIAINKRDDSRIEVVNNPWRYKVTATMNMSSKRVELLGRDTRNEIELPPCSKRRRLELTEHQKEVRRAQQGRERDGGGHGPGTRTYTGVDFSQGNDDDSQESREIRNPELILDLLRRAL
ncbi:hypothetical protein Nepgr_006393 [Nepenthes gracilis]|uniref:Telomere-associated protein Rif1 N-terminal domain-containing protein n=1 Tax=Nepenthes gracilis TaxID=150966 RepID=A0AAD3S514_NEPGR|nr:hypothetical protein Nepgr_006393 [Nepenthes gracilis]